MFVTGKLEVRPDRAPRTSMRRLDPGKTARDEAARSEQKTCLAAGLTSDIHNRRIWAASPESQAGTPIMGTIDLAPALKPIFPGTFRRMPHLMTSAMRASAAASWDTST